MKSWLSLVVLMIAFPAVAIETSFSNTFWLTGVQQSVRETDSNKNNALLNLPEKSVRFDWRPELKLSDDSTKIVVRPRYIVSSSTVVANNMRDTPTDYDWRWLDAYMSVQGKGDLAMTYGLQNFQWGPAEAASPSNTIFRESVQEKDLLFATIGQHILRFNYSPSQSWNFVLMTELSESGAIQPVAEEKFRPTALLKSEYSWSGGAQYLGIVFGGRQTGELTLGEYLNIEVTEGASVYFDISHERGSRAWYPVRNSATGLVSMSQERLKSEQIMTFAVLGGRYNFERGTDIRFEAIFQEAGYNTEQMGYRWQAVSTQTLPQLALLSVNASRLARSGLEYPGQKYVLLSVREPNFWGKKDWSIYFRVLNSLSDRSSLAYVASESAFGERGTLYFSAGTATGGDDSELRGLTNWNLLAGARLNW